ncbi:MAG: SoxR reducing system RseC family protein [Candidatus Dactylopiibacterium sp.]|nr:SoxR reducing system RseC family protein [Candidatus Dactylopiibacterium sp.]
MNTTLSTFRPVAAPLVEGVARVVAFDNGLAVLEPEQRGTCAGCGAAARCESQGIGSLAARLAQRRFTLPTGLALRVGDRVRLGVTPCSLLEASAIVYVLPLLGSLLAAALAQWRWASDAACLGAALAGLAAGFLCVRGVEAWRAGRAGPEFELLGLAGPDESSR